MRSWIWTNFTDFPPIFQSFLFCLILLTGFVECIVAIMTATFACRVGPICSPKAHSFETRMTTSGQVAIPMTVDLPMTSKQWKTSFKNVKNNNFMKSWNYAYVSKDFNKAFLESGKITAASLLPIQIRIQGQCRFYWTYLGLVTEIPKNITRLRHVLLEIIRPNELPKTQFGKICFCLPLHKMDTYRGFLARKFKFWILKAFFNRKFFPVKILHINCSLHICTKFHHHRSRDSGDIHADGQTEGQIVLVICKIRCYRK